jgi:hypothetical protein
MESIVKSLTGIEKVWKKDELLKFLEEIRKSNYFISYFKDKPIDDKSMSYILDNLSDTNIFIHYTKNEEDAKSILTGGFRFVDTFYKTALPVTDDKLDLIMKHNTRKYFGDFLIIISISHKIINSYSSELDKAGIKNFFIENILTESPPSRNENSDLVYLLPRQFIKGYINHCTGKIVKNPDFNPNYDSASFMLNINQQQINVKNTFNNNS